MVLQSHRCAEHRHDAVAGELVHRAAEALHHECRTTDHIRHDLAQPFGAHRRRDVHRVHDIGEEHRDLLVLGLGFGLGHRYTAAMAEPSIRQRFGAARAARHYGRHPTSLAARSQVHPEWNRARVRISRAKVRQSSGDPRDTDAYA